MTVVKKRVSAVFARPFRIPGLDETLPPGEYALDAEIAAPAGHPDPAGWKASVLIHLLPQPASPALARTLTVPLADLERALAENLRSAAPPARVGLDELLADPMVRLFMASDGVTEDQIRGLCSGPSAAEG